MLLWFHLVIPSFPARIDDMRSRFSALSRRGILFAHAPQKNVSNRWYAPALRVHKSQTGSGFNKFSAMFPFVTCVKESENQPHGFVES